MLDDGNQSKRKLWIIVGTVVFALGVVGTVLVLLFLNKDSDSSDTNEPLTLAALNESLKGVVDDASSVMADIATADNPNTVIYKMSDKSWVPLDDGAEALVLDATYSEVALNEADFSKVRSHLVGKGFSEVDFLGNVASSYSLEADVAQYFSSDNIFCNLSNSVDTTLGDEDGSSEAAYYLRVSCADRTSFDKNIAILRPFVETYSSSNGQDVLFGQPDVQDGSSEGYKNARVDVSTLGSDEVLLAEFYQTPDENWYFFTTTEEQGKVACDKYSSSDLKKAYLGFTCWNAETGASSFVQEEAPTFEIIPGAQG